MVGWAAAAPDSEGDGVGALLASAPPHLCFRLLSRAAGGCNGGGTKDTGGAGWCGRGGIDEEEASHEILVARAPTGGGGSANRLLWVPEMEEMGESM